MLRLAASMRKAGNTAYNDWVVVLLVLITGIITLFQFLGILGFIGKGALHPDDPHNDNGLLPRLLAPISGLLRSGWSG